MNEMLSVSAARGVSARPCNYCHHLDITALCEPMPKYRNQKTPYVVPVKIKRAGIIVRDLQYKTKGTYEANPSGSRIPDSSAGSGSG
jgi:hypothetical protein